MIYMMTDRIVGFLREIGLCLEFETIAGPTFLPGISIRKGVMLVDREKLRYPGDLLHEAGHLAVMSAEDRSNCNGDVGTDGGFEMAAIAWSYAAARAIGVSAEVLFHDDGYKGEASALRDNFEAGRGVGVPMLVWLGLSAKGAYPVVSRWLR
jgi:hypothetical protein